MSKARTTAIQTRYVKILKIHIVVAARLVTQETVKIVQVRELALVEEGAE